MALAAFVVADQMLGLELREDAAAPSDPADVLADRGRRRGRHGAGRLADATTTALSRRARAAGVPWTDRRDRLLDHVALGERVGPGQGERPDIGLVGGVGPVALILHLEGIALHAALTLDTGSEGMGDGAQVHHRLHRIDELGKARVGRPARPPSRSGRGTGDADDRVEHDKAGAGGQEIGDRLALGDEIELARGIAGDHRGIAQLLRRIAVTAS